MNNFIKSILSLFGKKPTVEVVAEPEKFIGLVEHRGNMSYIVRSEDSNSHQEVWTFVKIEYPMFAYTFTNVNNFLDILDEKYNQYQFDNIQLIPYIDVTDRVNREQESWNRVNSILSRKHK